MKKEPVYECLNLLENVQADDLQDKVVELDGLAKELSDLRDKFRAKRVMIKERVVVYEATRLERFKKWLEANGKDWCGVCDSIADLKDIKLLYVDHFRLTTEDYECGTAYAEIMKACPKCYDEYCFSKKRLFRDVHLSANEKRGHAADHQNGKYVYGVQTWIRPPGIPENHRGFVEYLPGPLKWMDIYEKTEVKLFPAEVSTKLTEVVGLPPHIEFVIVEDQSPQGSTWYSKVRHVSGKDYFIVNGKGLVKVNY